MDSPIPANASADPSLNSNLNLISSTISHNVYPISTPLEHGAQQPRSNPQDMSVIQESLDNLKLGKDHTIINEASSRTSDLYISDGKAAMNALETPAELEAMIIPFSETFEKPSPLLKSSRSQCATSSQQEGSAIRLMSRSSDTESYGKSSVISDGADSSPVIVVSSQSQSPEPFVDQLKTGLPILIDEPDERLLGALENPRDRFFVIKLEQDVINFIQENT